MLPIDLRPGTHEYMTVVGGVELGFVCTHRPVAHEWVLFIHGLGCSRETFAAAPACDSLSGFSLLLVDLIGFGASAKLEGFSYGLGDQASICEGLISRLPIGRLHLVAHSMGGAVALLLPPERLARLGSFVNVEGNLIAADCGLFSRGVSEQPFDEYRARVFPEQQRQFSGNPCLRLAHTTAVAMHRSACSLVRWSDSGELLERFRRLSCPRCYIWGEEDRAMPILERLDVAETLMIPASGHCMMVENPAAFYPALGQFLEAATSKGSLSPPRGA
jgi:pimeloyl-ACP methyl ester carboxylesterase